jgi:hypothetical protein
MIEKNELDNFKKNYIAKDFDKSIEILNDLKDQFEPGVYYYNIGTVKIKQGKLAEGRLFLEKAKDTGYYNHHVINNISKTKDLLGVVELEKPETTADYLNYYSMNLDSNIFLTFSLILFTLLTFFFKKLNIFLRFTIILLALVPLGFKFYYVDTLVKGIPLVDVDIFEGPSKVFEKTNVLNKGLLVKVINKQENWSYVIYPDKLQGWIKTTDIEVIK